MREVAKDFYCGNEADFYNSIICTYRRPYKEIEIMKCMPEGWAVVHACKEPFHRMALGYVTRGAPRNHPDYLYSNRPGNRLALNMIDADNSKYVSKEMVDVAIDYIDEKLRKGFKVLVHCNEGLFKYTSTSFAY